MDLVRCKEPLLRAEILAEASCNPVLENPMLISRKMLQAATTNFVPNHSSRRPILFVHADDFGQDCVARLVKHQKDLIATVKHLETVRKALKETPSALMHVHESLRSNWQVAGWPRAMTCHGFTCHARSCQNHPVPRKCHAVSELFRAMLCQGFDLGTNV